MRDNFFSKVDTNDVDWEPASGDILTKSDRHLRFMMGTDTIQYSLTVKAKESSLTPNQIKASQPFWLAFLLVTNRL